MKTSTVAVSRGHPRGFFVAQRDGGGQGVQRRFEGAGDHSMQVLFNFGSQFQNTPRVGVGIAQVLLRLPRESRGGRLEPHEGRAEVFGGRGVAVPFVEEGAQDEVVEAVRLLPAWSRSIREFQGILQQGEIRAEALDQVFLVLQKPGDYGDFVLQLPVLADLRRRFLQHGGGASEFPHHAVLVPGQGGAELQHLFRDEGDRRLEFVHADAEGFRPRGPAPALPQRGS